MSRSSDRINEMDTKSKNEKESSLKQNNESQKVFKAIGASHKTSLDYVKIWLLFIVFNIAISYAAALPEAFGVFDILSTPIMANALVNIIISYELAARLVLL